MFTNLARLGLTVAAMVTATTTITLAETSATPATTVVAQASPAPKATPSPFSYKGYIRAYDFTRQNASSGFSKANQQAFNVGINLHGDYKFNPNWSVGASYFYANPLNNCTSAQSHFTQPCKGAAPGLTQDDTLPGFEMSTLYEGYLAYGDKTTNGKVGYQVINTPWANPSDSRIKPNAFLGADLSTKFNANWSGELGYFNGFEDRVSSQFFRSTLLTYVPADAPGYTSLAAANGANGLTMITNSGFGYGRLGYTGNGLTTNLNYYAFSDIANAFWLDAKYALKGTYKPFVAAQFGSEKNTGKALVGIVDSQVFGLQGGVSFNKNVALTVGYDHVPSKTATITGTCPANHVVPTNAGAANYFLPKDSYNCVPGAAPGTMTVYYGGWASPYTDSYATDPFFTTTISQGMVDRRGFGDSGKAALTFTSNDKRFVTTIARALYAYGNGTVGVTPTQETNFDTQYFFNKLPKSGSYKGFTFRYRYAERTEQFAPKGVAPLFKYNRFQAEYDF